MTPKEEFILLNVRLGQDGATSEDGWVSYKPQRWTEERLDRKDRQANAQAVKDLDAAGLLEAQRDKTGACRWLRLTEEGEKTAAKLAEAAGLVLSSPKKPKPPLDRLRWFAGCMVRAIENNRQRMTHPLFIDNPQGREGLRKIIDGAEERLERCNEAIRQVEDGSLDGLEAIKRVF